MSSRIQQLSGAKVYSRSRPAGHLIELAEESMAHTTAHLSQTSFRRESPKPLDSMGDPNEDLASLIEDTIRMIENTRSFLNRLDHSQFASREAMALSCKRLEDALASLKRRQRTLGGCDC